MAHPIVLSLYPSLRPEGAPSLLRSGFGVRFGARVGFHTLPRRTQGLESFIMPSGLRRIQGGGDWHFITCSCYHRLPFLGSAAHRDLFLKILEQVRQKYDCAVFGYVVMPEHFHLLVTEPRIKTLWVMMQVLKQRVSRQRRRRQGRSVQTIPSEVDIAPAFWLPRYYDFNVYSREKRIEKLRYMHRNPVKRGLVASPEEWRWSSYRFYRWGEKGVVKIGDE